MSELIMELLSEDENIEINLNEGHIDPYLELEEPTNSTTSEGKVLTVSSTAGSISWVTPVSTSTCEVVT